MMFNKSWKPLVLILILSVLAAYLYLDFNASAENTASQSTESTDDMPTGTSIGELAPDITGTTLDGETLSLCEFRGNLIMVNVFASWCGPCRAEIPHLVEVFDEAGLEEIKFIGLNLSESPEAVRIFKDEFDINFPILLNQDGRLTEVYQPIGLPTSWFIDAYGVVRYVFVGPMTKDMLKGILEDIKAGREPDPFASDILNKNFLPLI
jgi:thiol-disulfide isomerase/thioredoxin